MVALRDHRTHRCAGKRGQPARGSRHRCGDRRDPGRRLDTVAVSCLFSFLNDVHERRIGERLRQALPEVGVYLSCEVLPQIREFERASTTAVCAYVGPLLAGYLDRLQSLRRHPKLPVAPHRSLWSNTGREAKCRLRVNRVLRARTSRNRTTRVHRKLTSAARQVQPVRHPGHASPTQEDDHSTDPKR